MVALVFLTPVLFVMILFNFILQLWGKKQITMSIIPWIPESAEKADESDPHTTPQQKQVLGLARYLAKQVKQKKDGTGPSN